MFDTDQSDQNNWTTVNQFKTMKALGGIQVSHQHVNGAEMRMIKGVKANFNNLTLLKLNNSRTKKRIYKLFISWKLRSIPKFPIQYPLRAITGGWNIFDAKLSPEMGIIIFLLTHWSTFRLKVTSGCQNWTLLCPKWPVSPHLTDRHLTDRLNVRSIIDRTDIWPIL